MPGLIQQSNLCKTNDGDAIGKVDCDDGLRSDLIDALAILNQIPTDPVIPHRSSRLACTVIVADPDRAVAQLLAGSLNREWWVSATHVCDNSAEALQLAGACSAPLVVAEWQLRDKFGIHLAYALREQCPCGWFVLWTHRLADVMLEQLLQLPIHGCFLKQDSLSELCGGLESVAREEPCFSASVRARMVADGAKPAAVRELAFLRELPPRHFEVLLRLAEGASVKTIAAAMGVSMKTVDSLKYRMMKRLQLHDRVELARWAIREGLINA